MTKGQSFLQKERPQLTEGPIVSTLIALAVPIMMSSFLSTLYNLCDMAWVGTLGAKAVAGVGVGGMYLWLSGGIMTLPRMGGQVLTAQAIGGERKKDAKDYAKSALQLVTMFSIIFGLVSVLFTKQMVGFFNLADEVSRTVADGYMKITCGFIIFSFLNGTLSGLFTATGDSKTPMVASVCGLLLNILLDPLLIKGIGPFPKMEAIGAAVATVFSQAVVTVIFVIKMRTESKQNEIFSKQQYLQPCSVNYYRQIVQIGLPAAIQGSVYCFISMVLTRLVSGFGAEAVAISRVGGQIESVSWNTADGFSSALNAFCGQNYGARKMDRIKKGYLFSVMITFVWGLLVLFAFVALPEPISKIFFHEELAIQLSIAYLMVIGISEPFLMVEIITGGALSGLGLTKLCSILTVTFTALRIPIAYILKGTVLGINGIWWAFTITTVLKGIILTITFLRVTNNSEYKSV